MSQQPRSAEDSTFEFEAAENSSSKRPKVSPEELLHLSRLITIGELSACFAHEVTNPLMLIKGHIRFLGETLPAGDPLRANFEVIERASQRIEELAKCMLDFSRRRSPQTQPCELAELISDALRFVQPYLRTQFIDVQVHLDTRLRLINLDRWQMIHALVNLLQNAADSMMDVDQRVLSITGRIAEGAMRIAISDTGTGIAPFLAIVKDPETYERFERVVLTHGVRGVADLAYADYIRPPVREIAISHQVPSDCVPWPNPSIHRATSLHLVPHLGGAGRDGPD